MSISLKLRLLTLLFCLLYAGIPGLKAQIYLDSTKPVEARVADLLSRMTLDEKIGQMIQIERQAFTDPADLVTYNIGSILSGGGSNPTPNSGQAWADMYDGYQSVAITSRLHIPLIYGVDAVHGHNNLKNAVIFPHNIGLGCSRNPELVKQAARITALEVMGTGIDWTFSPCIAVVRNERWGRTYEGFGESTDLVTQMGVASVLGYQGDSLSATNGIVACAKHYIGDGGTTNGQDQGNTEVNEQTLRQLYLEPYRQAIDAGVGTVMASYSSWNGQKMHGHKYLLTDVLKGELGFDGFVVSDYSGIDQLPGSYADQVEASVNAGMDMVMLPFNFKEFTSTMKMLVSQNKISQERIDDAVSRILRIKFRMGLFEHPFTDRSLTAMIGSAEHRDVARACVRESLVLLSKKDNVLPLPKNNAIIHVAGKNADDIGNQCGGWSIYWQGSSGNITEGTTILEAIRNTAGAATVTTSADGSGASGADYGVAVIGETPYAEGAGDRADLNLTSADIATVRNMKQMGMPVVVILISGRPMILDPILPYCDAVIAAWLPGTEGQGIADVLFGDFQPKGLLSHSWLASMKQVPINTGDADYSPLFAYGHGITTLENSPEGSAPVFYAGAVSVDGSSVEASFNKAMALPQDFSGFTVQVNGLVTSVTAVSLKPNDLNTLVLRLSKPVVKSNAVTIAYTPGNYYSADGGKLEAFTAKTAYNILTENKVHVLPALVQAEDYTAMSGIQTENTTDVGGGMNVGWIDTGDWMDYMLDVPVKGIYKIEYRVSSLSTGGEISLQLRDSLIVSAEVPVTGGWQTWRSVNVTCKLDKGLARYRQDVKKGGINFNWFRVTLVMELEENDTITTTFVEQNYPNPFLTETTMKYTVAEKMHVQALLTDISGKYIATLIDAVKDEGNHVLTINKDVYGLQSGTYFVKFRAGEYEEVKKIIIR